MLPLPSALLTEISPAQNVDDLFDQRKAQAVALRGVRGIALIELLKDARAGFRAHAAARVRDGHDGLLPLRVQAAGDRAAALCELDRVGKQVIPDEAEQLRVRADGHVVLDVGFDAQPLRLPDLLKAQQAGAQLLAEVEGRSVGEDLLVFQLVQLQNVGDEPGEPLHRAGDRLRVLHALLLRQRRVLQQRRVVADDGQRGLELVGDAGEEVGAQRLHARQLLRHPVDPLDDPIQLAERVVGFDGRDAHREIPLLNPLKALNDPADVPVHGEIAVQHAAAPEHRGEEQDVAQRQRRVAADDLLVDLHGVQQDQHAVRDDEGDDGDEEDQPAGVVEQHPGPRTGGRAGAHLSTAL